MNRSNYISKILFTVVKTTLVIFFYCLTTLVLGVIVVCSFLLLLYLEEILHPLVLLIPDIPYNDLLNKENLYSIIYMATDESNGNEETGSQGTHNNPTGSQGTNDNDETNTQVRHNSIESGRVRVFGIDIDGNGRTSSETEHYIQTSSEATHNNQTGSQVILNNQTGPQGIQNNQTGPQGIQNNQTGPQGIHINEAVGHPNPQFIVNEHGRIIGATINAEIGGRRVEVSHMSVTVDKVPDWSFSETLEQTHDRAHAPVTTQNDVEAYDQMLGEVERRHGEGRLREITEDQICRRYEDCNRSSEESSESSSESSNGPATP